MDVNIDTGNHITMTQPAQIFSIIELKDNIKDSVEYIAIIKYLRVVDPNAYPFPQLVWEEDADYSIISIEEITMPATVIPLMHILIDTYRSVKPKPSDRFWYVPRTFTDKSGWDTISSITVENETIPIPPVPAPRRGTTTTTTTSTRGMPAEQEDEYDDDDFEDEDDLFY